MRLLRHRLPNPPPAFVGRKKELALLQAVVSRAPVSLLWGMGGLGKTALALQLLHERFESRVERAVYVRLSSPHTSGELAREVITALGELEGHGPYEAPESQEPLIATAIDLAEASGHWIVVDDVHLGDAKTTDAQIDLIARYARKSRWILLSRVKPQVTSCAAQTLALTGMSTDDLAELARTLRPESTARELQAAAQRSTGSPWLLRRAVVQGTSEPGSLDVLGGLSAPSRDVATALSMVTSPLSKSVLELFTAESLEVVCQELEEHGLLVRAPDQSVRLHDVAKAHVIQVLDDPSTTTVRSKVVAALSEESDPIVRLEVLRLHQALGNDGSFRSALETWSAALFKAGYAQQLRHLLEESNDPTLDCWHFRVSVELGQPLLNHPIMQNPPQTAIDLFYVARAHQAQGRLDEAVKAARTAAHLATADDDIVFAETCLAVAAQYSGSLGHYDEAIDLCSQMRGAQPDLRLRRDSQRLLCLLYLKRLDEGRVAIPEVEAQLEGAGLQAQTRAANALCMAYHFLGQPEECLAVLTRAAQNPLLISSVDGRILLSFLAAAYLERGELDRASDLLNRLWPFVERFPSRRPVHLSMVAVRRLVVGDLVGIEDVYDDIMADCRSQRRYLLYVNTAFQRGMINAMRGNAGFPEMEAEALEADRRGWSALGKLEEHIRRRGVVPVDGWPENIDLGEPATELNRLESLSAMVDNDGDGAVLHAREAVAKARAAGNHLREIDLVQLTCEALLSSGRFEELSGQTEELANMAERFGSIRLATEARFFAAVGKPAQPGLLEAVAAAGDSCPMAARRSQALLGGDPKLDCVDAVILAAVRRAHPWPEVRWVAGKGSSSANWKLGWGIDSRRHEVWLPDGVTVELGNKGMQWRTLELLCAHPGGVSREKLVNHLWQADYHPLKHDNRLKLTVHKLRKLLEEDPAVPKRIVTTEDGYGLGGVVRRLG